MERALAEEKSPRLAADRPEQKGPTLAPKAGGKSPRELLRETVEGSIAAQREGAQRAEDQRKLDEGLSKGLFESIAGKQERFDEGGRENLSRAPGNTALPLSIARVQGTEAQNLAIGNCLDAAEKAPAIYSEEHLLRFVAPFIVTYAYIFFCSFSSKTHVLPSTTLQCSPTTCNKLQIHSFGIQFDARLFSAQERSSSELLRTL